jgi:uncharacterized protein with ParB-like and HNH nuclease domain
MDNGQKTLNSLFDGKKIFKIPEYQRAYAWDIEKQLPDFLDDFKNQKLDKDYFFGTILFQEMGKHGVYDIIEIVDGQQRITTLIIFMNILLSLVSGIDENDLELYKETYIKYRAAYKLQVLSDDNEFFQTYIIERNPMPKGIISTPSQKKLYKAKEYFEEKLSTEFTNNELLELLEKVAKTKVLTYSVQDKAEATLIFETTNDRGKELTNLEKTKSFLMYKTYITNDEPTTMLDAIQSRFSNIYRAYQDIENEGIDENSILLYNFIAYGIWSLNNQKEYYSYMNMVKNHLNDMIKNGDINSAMQYIDEYSKTLRETFIIVREILMNPVPEFTDIKILNRLAVFYPMLIKCYRYDSTDEKTEFRKICHLCEIFSFRAYSICRKLSNAGESRFYTLARDFNGDFEQLRDNLKDMINGYSPEKDFMKLLGDSDFYEYYSSPVKNYFFWKYENYLRAVEQPVASELLAETFTSKDAKLKFSIEHIVSQNPKKSMQKVILEALKHDRITESFAEKYLHSIGNLTIDPSSANNSKGNMDVDEKNSYYFRKAPFKTQNELESFLVEEKWTHKSIETRADKLFKFAQIQWCDLDK